MADEDVSKRKLRAKRQNERVKLAASFLNTMALAVVGAAFVVPAVTSFDLVRWSRLPLAVALHILVQAMLGLLRSEE